MTAAFTLKRLPLPRCEPHNAYARWSLDGTRDAACDECLRIVMGFAEMTLRLDRELHRHHAAGSVPTCPYCYPGAVS